MNSTDLNKPVPSPADLNKTQTPQHTTSTSREGSIGEDGKLNGQGKKTYPDGKIEEGTFVNDRLHGQGTRINDKGVVIIGKFTHGVSDAHNILRADIESEPSINTTRAKANIEDFEQVLR